MRYLHFSELNLLSVCVIEETKQGVPETKSEIKEVPPAKKGVSLVKSWKSSLK